MKLKQLLIKRRSAMGRNPSHSAFKEPFTLGNVEASLRRVGYSDISFNQIDRIQQRIFAHQHAGNGEFTEVPERRLEDHEQILAHEIDEIFAPSEHRLTYASEGMVAPTSQPRLRLARPLLIKSILFFLLTTLLATVLMFLPVSRDSAAPLWLNSLSDNFARWFANSDLQRAEISIGIAESRLSRLGTLDSLQLTIVGHLTSDMDIAGLEALGLLKFAPSGPKRMRLLGALYGLAIAEYSVLDKLAATAATDVEMLLRNSQSTAQRIAQEARSLLEPNPRVEQQEQKQVVSRPRQSTGRAPTSNYSLSQQAEVHEEQSQDVPSSPSEEIDDCDINQGQICITVPPLPEL